MFNDKGALQLDEQISVIVKKVTAYIKKSEASLKLMVENSSSNGETVGDDKGGASFVKKDIVMNVQ